jgi:hypothetical protein
MIVQHPSQKINLAPVANRVRPVAIDRRQVDNSDRIRGEQLALLRGLQLQTVEQDKAKVTGATLKSVLRAIDDHARDDSTCWASTGTIAKETCLSDRTVRRAIRALENLGYIYSSGRCQGNAGEILIDWNRVRTSATITDDDDEPTSVMLTTTSETLTATSETLTKTSAIVTDKTTEATRNDNKRHSPSLRSEAVDVRLARLMFEKIAEVAPKTKKPNFDKWANTIRLMRESDRNSPDDIERVFLWANSDDFWRANILCPDTLRKQFSRLHAKMLAPSTASFKRRSANLGPGVVHDPAASVKDPKYGVM